MTEVKPTLDVETRCPYGNSWCYGPTQPLRCGMLGDGCARDAEHAPIGDSYACQACGRRDGLDAVVTDDVWVAICGGLNLLCLWCIDKRVAALGLTASASLHFAGTALSGTSQSDADQDHVSRLVAALAQRDRQIKASKCLVEALRLLCGPYPSKVTPWPTAEAGHAVVIPSDVYGRVCVALAALDQASQGEQA